MNPKPPKALLLFAACAAFGAVGWLLWNYIPAAIDLASPEKIAALQAHLVAFGPWGAAVLSAAQAVQVITGFLPALPIQICAGLSYGALGGLLVCMVGILCGSALVFTAVKKFGRPLIDRYFSAKKQRTLRFLQDHNRLEQVVFLLYLLPAMPKDVLTYLAALTPLTLRRYLLLTVSARIPTVLCTTYASNAIIQGDYSRAVLVFCISGTLGLVGMLSSGRVLTWLKSLQSHRRK